MAQMSLSTKEKQTPRHRNQSCGCQGGECREMDWECGVSRCNIYIYIYGIKAGDMGSIPRSRRSPGEGNDDALLYSCLGNPMDRGA